MSRDRETSGDATKEPKRSRMSRVDDWLWGRVPLLSPAAARAVGGFSALLTVLALGLLTQAPWLARRDLRVDTVLARWRFPAATDAFLSVTAAASEAVGLTAVAAGVVVLLLRRRRFDAARLMLMAGSSWLLAIAIKNLFDRPRPPARLWALVPDPTGSFPSGHDTTASIMVVVALLALAGLGRIRVVATTTAVLFSLLVGASRVYLGDHYPTDVLGSYLTVLAATLLAWAVTDLAVVRRVGGRALRDPSLTSGSPERHRASVGS
jgi:undecaprenyl-diphosphatase